MPRAHGSVVHVGDVVPIVVEVALPTTTISSQVITLPIVGGNLVYRIHRIIHSFVSTLAINAIPPAAAVADAQRTVTARYALSLEEGLATIPTYRRNATFWEQRHSLTYGKSAAAGSLSAIRQTEGMQNVYLPLPPPLVGSARLTLYKILADDTIAAIGTTSTLELSVEIIPASADVLLSIARSGQGFM